MPEEPTGAALPLAARVKKAQRRVRPGGGTASPIPGMLPGKRDYCAQHNFGVGLGGFYFFFPYFFFFDCLQRWKVEEQMQRRGETLQKTLESPEKQKGRGRQGRGRGCAEEGDPVNLPA